MSSPSIQDQPIQPNPTTFFGKAAQLLSRRDVQIAGAAIVAFAGITLASLYKDRIITTPDKDLFPNADQECVTRLTKEFEKASPEHGGVQITNVFGGIHGYCSLPKLDRDTDKLIRDPNEMTSSLMRSTRGDIHYLAIKTEIACDCNSDDKTECLDKKIGVEQLIWTKDGKADSDSLFFPHLDRDKKDRLEILKSLHEKGSADISLTGITRNPLLPENYSITLVETKTSKHTGK